MTKEKLIKLFLCDGPPYVISWEYRRRNGSYQEDKPILNELVKEGMVREVSKGSKNVLFQYIGPV